MIFWPLNIDYWYISPRYIAVTYGKHVQVWHAPAHSKEFAPFSVHRTYTGLYDETVCIDWSSDSRLVHHDIYEPKWSGWEATNIL